jgi:putative FmdB family regulatory protein
MPTYEYRCTQCETPLEVVQSIHEPALTECPTCGGRLRKVFGNVGVVFKGSGFYRTDSRGKKTAATPGDKPAEKSAEKAPAAAGASASAGTGGSDSASKPAASPAASSSGASTGSSSTSS